MMRSAKLFAVLCLAGLTPAASAQRKENLEKRSTYNVKGVALVTGELLVKAKGEDAWRFQTVWRFRKTPHGTLIYLSQRADEKTAGWDGWYLNYDHKSKAGRARLVP